jgi:hypothetical protein
MGDQDLPKLYAGYSTCFRKEVPMLYEYSMNAVYVSLYAVCWLLYILPQTDLKKNTHTHTLTHSLTRTQTHVDTQTYTTHTHTHTHTHTRTQAGSHGKDAWGIFRIHQFEKVMLQGCPSCVIHVIVSCSFSVITMRVVICKHGVSYVCTSSKR